MWGPTNYSTREVFQGKKQNIKQVTVSVTISTKNAVFNKFITRFSSNKINKSCDAIHFEISTAEIQTFANQRAKKKKEAQKSKTLKKESKYLGGKWARGIDLLANQITGGDVRNTEKIGKTRSIGTFTYTRTTKKNPLDISFLRFLMER